MSAFTQGLRLPGSVALRELEMFAAGFAFDSVQLYGSEKRNQSDNYQGGKGILGTVGLIGVGLVSENKTETKANEHARLATTPAEKPALNSPEGQQVRNASGDHLEAVKAANPNMSDGSVHNWAMKSPAEKLAYAASTGQDASLQLFDRNSAGKEVVIAARLMPAEAATATTPEQLTQVDNRSIKDYGYEVKHVGEQQVIKTVVEYQAGKPPEVTERSLFEKIAALPLDQQAQVIGAGIKAYSGEMTHQQIRIGVGMIAGFGDGVLGLAHSAENLGQAIIGVAQFSRDAIENRPAAAATAHHSAESLGKLLVNGVRVYSTAEGYMESVGAATSVGDYGKALRDVAWLGQQMNSRWEAMTPEEKTRLTTKLATENLGGFAVGFGTDKLAKSIKITEALEALGAEASTMAPAVKDKVNKFINRLADELFPQSAVAAHGELVTIPRTEILKPGESDLGSHVMEMTRYFEYGKKNPITAAKAADLVGVSKKELRHMTEEQLEAKGIESVQKHYDRLFYEKHPDLKGTNIEVHHALPQTLLDQYPGLFKAK